MSFPLETYIDNIYNSNTRKYFKEVIETYFNNNFRSSVVMLYSVVVCDLIYKLQDLVNIYNDSTAQSILSKIKNLQVSSQRSAEWENQLIDKVYKQTSFLEVSDYENIKYLQKHRHLSAHPVLTSTELLYSPNKDTVRTHIRNMLEGVLTKPPIFSKKVFDYLISDLSENKYKLIDDDSLRRYLHSKFLKSLKFENECSIFKSLWKLVFRLVNNETNSNREINYRTLTIIFNDKKTEYLKFIESDPIFFSDISSDKPFEYFVNFLSQYPKVYSLLSQDCQIIIKQTIETNNDYVLKSWFISNSFDSHISWLTEFFQERGRFLLDTQCVEELLEKAKENDHLKETLDFGIFAFSKCPNFSAADRFFNQVIRSNYSQFSENQLVDIIKAIDSNDQLHKRGRATKDSTDFFRKVNTRLPSTFKLDEYPNFKENIE